MSKLWPTSVVPAIAPYRQVHASGIHNFPCIRLACCVDDSFVAFKYIANDLLSREPVFQKLSKLCPFSFPPSVSTSPPLAAGGPGSAATRERAVHARARHFPLRSRLLSRVHPLQCDAVKTTCETPHTTAPTTSMEAIYRAGFYLQAEAAATP